MIPTEPQSDSDASDLANAEEQLLSSDGASSNTNVQAQSHIVSNGAVSGLPCPVCKCRFLQIPG